MEYRGGSVEPDQITPDLATAKGKPHAFFEGKMKLAESPAVKCAPKDGKLACAKE